MSKAMKVKHEEQIPATTQTPLSGKEALAAKQGPELFVGRKGVEGVEPGPGQEIAK